MDSRRMHIKSWILNHRDESEAQTLNGLGYN